MTLGLNIFSIIAMATAPAPAPAPAESEEEKVVPESAADADDEAVDDEAAELWKLQELEQEQGAPTVIVPTEAWLPQNDVDMAKRAGMRERRTHPEDVVALLERNPAALFGQRLAVPALEALWPMFVEYDGKAGLFDPKDYDIPMATNPAVEQWIRFFTGAGREYFNRWLARSTRYIPIFREILREANLPQDTVYLAMIESGFHVRAFSRAKASGPWQFMSFTGKRFNLRIDSWIDERRDWIKATQAAAAYLKELHGQLGDWYLAWAGYNAGGGKLSKAIARYDTRDFWELTKGRYLKSETKNYVPKLIAAAIVAKSPRRFGFTEVDWQKPFDFDTVEVDGGIDIRWAAKALDMDPELLLEMNPALKYGLTPPGEKWPLRVPRTDKQAFLTRLAELVPKTQNQFRVHVARRGESLAGIAAVYGSTVDAIRDQNHLPQDVRLRRGQEVLVPIVPGVVARPAPKPQPAPARVAQAPIATPAAAPKDGLYVVQQGDSLWSISQSYGCTIADLKRANGISNHRGLQVGQQIKIP